MVQFADAYMQNQAKMIWLGMSYFAYELPIYYSMSGTRQIVNEQRNFNWQIEIVFICAHRLFDP